MEPSTCFLWRRRKKVQQPKMSAPAARRPRGTPRPIPIFWPLVRPEDVEGGASGISEEDGLVEEEADME